MKKHFLILAVLIISAASFAESPVCSSTLRNNCYLTLWGSNLKSINFDPGAVRVDFRNTEDTLKNFWYSGGTSYEGAKGLLSMLLTAKTYSYKFQVYITSGYYDDHSNCQYTSLVLDPP